MGPEKFMFDVTLRVPTFAVVENKLVVVTAFEAYTFPVTSTEAAGFVVPKPVCPELFTKNAEDPVDVTTFIT